MSCAVAQDAARKSATMRALRPSFVVTVAAIGLVPACSDVGDAAPASEDTGSALDAAETADTTSAADATNDVADADAHEADVADAIVNPAQCPASDPGIGAARKKCAAPPSVKCTYPDLCPQHPAATPYNEYICFDDGTGGHWTLSSTDYVPACPTDQPKDGDPCPCTIHMGYVACNYGACEDLSRTYAACKGIDTFDPTWHVTGIACNPPELDAAVDGDATDGDGGDDGG
jgi:hypothetical protein